MHFLKNNNASHPAQKQLISPHPHWLASCLTWWRTSIMCATGQMPSATIWEDSECLVNVALRRGRKPPVLYTYRGRAWLPWKRATFSQFDEVVTTQKENITSPIPYRQRLRSQLWHNWCQMHLFWCVDCAGHCCVAIDVHFCYDVVLAILLLNRNILWLI